MRDIDSKRIDLRSDTVTQPTMEMRQAMSKAVVGDDVLGDDPTVQRLESMISELCGKDAGLFVPSGTMSNAVALKTHTTPGDEIITERYSHIYLYEGGGYAALCGSSIALPEGQNGLLSPELVEKSIRKQKGSQSHYPDGSLVCVENTANRGGGTCYQQDVLDAIAEVSKSKNCSTHIDGARIFNATVATNTPLSRMTRDYDSVSICLSKGLGAPVGSVLVGSNEFIEQAHRWRKMFGGGMRQSGILAAAGIYAIENNIERMEKDHARAKTIARAIDEMDHVSVDVDAVQTNMVYFSANDYTASEVSQKMAKAGIDMFDISPTHCRIVTHLHITDEDVQGVIEALASLG
ncbi:MAG: low-specificity L-threonine aldolase [Euryarchaeota archaeon]|nr:low-specificity L-threonine aldolase [Euryarchaeota archaeon]